MKELCECKHAKLVHGIALSFRIHEQDHFVNRCMITTCICRNFKEISNFGRVEWISQNIIVRNVKYYFWILWAVIRGVTKRVWKFVSYDYPIIQVVSIALLIVGGAIGLTYLLFSRPYENSVKMIVETKNVQCYTGSKLLYDGPVSKYRESGSVVKIVVGNEFYRCTAVKVYPR